MGLLLHKHSPIHEDSLLVTYSPLKCSIFYYYHIEGYVSTYVFCRDTDIKSIGKVIEISQVNDANIFGQDGSISGEKKIILLWLSY